MFRQVADQKPEWMGRFVAFPDRAGDFNMSQVYSGLGGSAGQTALNRLKTFGGERTPVFYDEKLQEAHHIHFPADGSHRVLQHHYGQSLSCR